MLEKSQVSLKVLTPFLAKLTTIFLLLFLALEILEFSLFSYYSYKLFILEISFLLLNLLFDCFLMKKNKNSVKLLIKFILNLFLIIAFIELRLDLFKRLPITYHKIHLIYMQFWLISMSFSVKILQFKRLRFLSIFLQYSYFKFRIILFFDFDKDFLIENLFIYIFFIISYKIESKIEIFFLKFIQELENYKTLFKLSDLSTEGIAIINGEHDILYSSSGFNKVFLPNEIKEQPILSLNGIFLKKTENSQEKNINNSSQKKKITIDRLKNLKLFKEIEDLNILSPTKTQKKKLLSFDTYDKSFIAEIKKPVSLQESHLLLNEGIDSEENLLLMLNRSKNAQKTKIINEKSIIIPDKKKEEKHGLFLNEILEKLFTSEAKRESIETLPGNLSGIEFFNDKIHVKLKTPQFEKLFNPKSINSVQIDQKPLVFFFQEEEEKRAYYSIILVPFRFLHIKGVFITIRSLFQEIFSYYMDKIELFQEKFIRTMSHELRTPINGSLALLEEINRSFSLENVENYLNPAICNLKIFHNTVNDIFDFSNLFLNKFQIAPLEFRLKSLLLEIISLVKPLTQRKNIEISLDYDEKLPKKIVSDPLRIRQILLNLLTNSIRFTTEGSIILSVKTIKEGVEFSVKDTGIGISQEKHRSLFKMSLEKEGTIGFGLTISNLLAKELNSDKKGLFIESEEHKGCLVSFSVSFEEKFEELPSQELSPNLNEMLEMQEKTCSLKEVELEKKFFDYINENANNEVKMLKSEDASEKNSQKVFTVKTVKKCQCFDVLIVDDNEFNLIALKLLLEKRKLKIDQARNGQEAIKKIVENLQGIHEEKHICRYKMIFMDLDMPVKNGFEACEELMVIFSNFDVKIPIIACTAFQENEKEKCLRIGMNGFLTKPINSKSLEDMLLAWLEY